MVFVKFLSNLNLISSKGDGRKVEYDNEEVSDARNLFTDHIFIL